MRGRLTSVTTGGVVTEWYAYDLNGNRTNSMNGAAVYDAQDRMAAGVGATFAYDLNGSQTNRIVNGQPTAFSYDLFGQLASAILPDGRVVSYDRDALSRVTAKRIDGVKVKGWIYKDALKPIAETDAAGNVVSFFVYGTSGLSPDYMVKDGVTYRFIRDVQGSVRLVVDSATGLVAQRLDYDAFGNVLLDTNPGFQPFGFQSGLYDPDTALVQFGVRWYDAKTGRWLSKDPILLEGGFNLYVFCGNDPVNFADPLGLWFGIDDAIFAGTGAILGIAGRLAGDILTGSLSNWEDYAGSAAGGAVAGEVLLYTANPVLAGAAGGLVGNVTGQGLNYATGNQSGIDAGSAIFDTVFGAATGLIPGRPKIQGVNAGRGSDLQVFRQIIKKAENGTIQHLTRDAATRMARGAFYEYAFGQGAAAGAVGSKIYGMIIK